MPEARKQIIWASPAKKEKTKLSVVYVHGFSGTHKITAPTFRNIAKQLNANLYLARLSGHGRTPDAMAEPDLQDWINDTAEAIAIGKAIGEKLILISLSTGTTLVSMILAEQPNVADVLINMAPNFNPADPAAQLIVGPGVNHYLALLLALIIKVSLRMNCTISSLPKIIILTHW